MSLLYDFKFALRAMLQKPSFALMTTAIMTIGLSLCIYNYSFIYGFMFKPLPFNNGDRMYVINLVANGVEYNGGSIRPADYLVIKEELKGVEQIGAYYFSTVDISGGERTLREPALSAQATVFEYTQVRPLKGRVFTDEDNKSGSPKVAVISYQFWQNHFGGREDIIGHNVFIDGETTQVVGVMPDGYTFPNSINVWLPMQQNLEAMERSEYLALSIFILLEKGYPLTKVNAQLAAIMKRLENAFPDTNTGNSALAKNYRMSQVGNGGMVVTYAMLGAVLFIMLLACTNVSNLLLARASERAKETAIRVALGAPRARLIMQMMWESLIICSMSGVVAILIAGWGLQVTEQIISGFINGRLPFFWQFSLDTHIVVVTLIIVLITTLVTGLIPALKSSGSDFNAILRDGTRGAQSRRAGKVSNILVVLEITLSCALLTTASALTLAINITDSSDYGANTDNKLIARIELPERKYPTAQDRINFYQDIEAELTAQPDVAIAALAGNIPGNNTWFTRIAIEGKDNADIGKLPQANVTNMMPTMFKVLDIKPIAGRLFDDADTLGKPVKVVVTDTFALQNFASIDDAIGKRFQLAQTEEESSWFTITGVIPHIIFGQPFADFKHRPSVIINSLQDSLSYMRIVVKPSAGLSADGLEDTVSRVLHQLDKDVAPYFFRTYETLLTRNTAGMNFLSDVFNLFAFAALVLAASGIYGVMSNVIARRTQELGIRRALGAPDEAVLKMLMKQGLWQLFIGACIGAPLAYLMGSRIVALIGVESMWLNVMYVLMPMLIGLVVLLSTYLPTLRAIRLEPSVALRYE